MVAFCQGAVQSQKKCQQARRTNALCVWAQKIIFAFAGMGKGLVGAFTRPASGVVDFASTSFDGLKRVAENIEEARRVRPPRFLHRDGILRPYIHVEAEGNDILQVIAYVTLAPMTWCLLAVGTNNHIQYFGEEQLLVENSNEHLGFSFCCRTLKRESLPQQISTSRTWFWPRIARECF